MNTLAEFDFEPARGVRTPIRANEYLACPCSAPLDKSSIGTVEITAERTALDVLAHLDVDVLFRGWECPAESCNRIILDAVNIDREDGRERELRDGRYPISVDVDSGDSAVGFAPTPHVDELIEREVTDE